MIQNESSLVCSRCGAKGEYERTNSFEIYPEGWRHIGEMDICPECSAEIVGQICFFIKSCYPMIAALSEK